MATIRFTEGDRDSRGFIRLSPPSEAEETDDAPLLAVAAPRPVAPARPPLSPQLRYQLTIASAAIAGVLLILLSLRLSAPRAMEAGAPAAAFSPMPAPTAPIVSTATPAPATMLPAYGAPNEAPRWQIESTRSLTPTAHYGGDWIQADVAGSGRIWLRAADWPGMAIGGPDLAPRPTATMAPVPPTATPEPLEPCLTAGPNGQVVTVCGWGNLETEAKAKWIATYGGNVGTVITPSPYGGTK